LNYSMLRQRREIRPFIYVKKRHIKWKQENKSFIFSNINQEKNTNYLNYSMLPKMKEGK
jgi:hypothetical protein